MTTFNLLDKKGPVNLGQKDSLVGSSIPRRFETGPGGARIPAAEKTGRLGHSRKSLFSGGSKNQPSNASSDDSGVNAAVGAGGSASSFPGSTPGRSEQSAGLHHTDNAAPCCGTHRTAGSGAEPQLPLSYPSSVASHPRRNRLPAGNKFFPDVEREVTARAISWAMDKGGDSALFATLTFKSEVTKYRAEKQARRWLARAQQSLTDKGGRQLKSFRATEWQKRGVIHYHLLLVGNGLDSLSRKQLENRWEAMGGGFARIYEADRKAAPYLAKYTSKSLAGELEWGGTWQGLRYPASVSRTQAGAPTGPG